MRPSVFALGFLLVLSAASSQVGCSTSSASNDSCGSQMLPACPAGATCGGPCDLDASVTACGSISPCSAFCQSTEVDVDAGEAGAQKPVAVWECTAP